MPLLVSYPFDTGDTGFLIPTSANKRNNLSKKAKRYRNKREKAYLMLFIMLTIFYNPNSFAH